MRICLAVLFFLVIIVTSGQKVNVRPVPNWVRAIDYSTEVSDTTGVSGGYYDLLSDDQL